MSGPPAPVGRGGLKLRHALETFAVDPAGLVCADFGCNVGGFTAELLDRGAARVYAVDTGYGALAWRLRQDARVVVMERTSALHATPPDGGVDLVTIDLGWTPQRLAIPAALGWLRAGGRIIALVKPHYELSARDPTALPRGGVLDESTAERVAREVADSIGALGAECLGLTRSPIAGGGGKGGRAGNAEWLMLASRAG